MYNKVKHSILKLPKCITVFDIPLLKQEVENYSRDVLLLLYDLVAPAIDDEISEKCKNYIDEKDLFNLDEDGREEINKACLVKLFILESIDSILTPFATGSSHSKSGNTFYISIDNSTYAIAVCSGFSYKSANNDTIKISLIKSIKLLDTLYEEG